jgi:hypothetical protein
MNALLGVKLSVASWRPGNAHNDTKQIAGLRS